MAERPAPPGGATAIGPDAPGRAPWWAGVLGATPGLVILATGVLLASREGGFPTKDWYPAALFVLVLAVVTVAAGQGRLRAPRGARLVALGALGALTVLSLLSIAWAVVPGDAWDGGNRTLLYLLAFGVVTLCAWPPSTLRGALGLVVAGVTTLALVVLLRAEAADYLGGRLAWPTGYSNATANLWLIAAFPALALAVDRGLHWALRGLALGAATLLVATSVLSQSRGAAGAVVVTAILLLAVIPRRWPAFAAIATVAAAIAAVWSRLLDVRDSQTVAELVERAGTARGSILLVTGAAALLGAAAAFAGTRTADAEGWPRARRAGDRAMAVMGLVALVAGIVALTQSPAWLDDRWQDFRQGDYSAVEDRGSRFTGALGSNRYDFYRVSLDTWAERPWVGTGADNFAVAYLEERRSPESPRYPHSLAFQLLAGLGIAGTALFVGFLAAVAWAFARRPRLGPGRGVAAAGALAGGAVWLIHGLVDWLWMFSGLGVLAFALLGLASRGDAPEPVSSPASEGLIAADERPAWALPLRLATVLVTVAAAVSLALPGISARFTSAALGGPQPASGQDLDRLDQAADFDPLSAQPLLALAVLARRGGDSDRAREALIRAVDREPQNWFAWFELGMTHAVLDERGPALEALRRAAQLNPRETTIGDVRARVAAGRKIDPLAVETGLSDQLRARQAPVDARQ